MVFSCDASLLLAARPSRAARIPPAVRARRNGSYGWPVVNAAVSQLRERNMPGTGAAGLAPAGTRWRTTASQGGRRCGLGAWVWRAHLSPLRELFGLIGSGLLAGRHLGVRLVGEDGAQQKALLRFSGHNGRDAGFSAAQHAGAGIEQQAPHGLIE